MSNTVSASNFPLLGQLVANLTRVRQNFDTLSQQASSGMISNTYAGLKGTVAVSLTLSSQIDSLTTTQSNIAAAGGPAQVTQTAMKQISSIAVNLLADMPVLNGINSASIDIVAANARDALAQIGELLNSQYAGGFVFAGQDSANAVVPDPNQITSSGFYLQISGAVAGLSVNGAAATAATTLAVASSTTVGTSPFSATYLAQPAASLTPPLVATGDGLSRPLGLLAGSNIGPISTGTSTTGSYMLDLMRALATVGSLTSSQANDPNFGALISDTQTSLTGAITAMNTDIGILGEQQSSLTTFSTTLSATQIVLTGQLSTAQDVDLAATLSNLSLVQTQLQESYQLIAAASGMSLAKFLPVS